LEPITYIINGCVSKDHKYQKILYERYRAFALKIVFRYIFHYDKARDVVNDGFVKFFTTVSTFRVENAIDTEKMLMGWIRRIMINVSIDELRRNRSPIRTLSLPDHLWEIPDHSENAEQAMRYRDLILLLNKLPDKYRLVFNMFVIDGYSHQDIADLLSTTIGNSKSILSRSRIMMQKLMKEQETTLHVFTEPRYG
jgi:RNA polymerase sigma factor (sigma-70 family)